MYLGLDIGTSSVKALLIDERQRIVASASEPLKVARPHPGWSEQAPDGWWRACAAALDRIAQAEPKRMAAVRGIGLSGQMHGATLLDSSDKPLRRAILWNDGRSAEECRVLEEREPAFRTIGGNILMPGFTAPKVEWVRRNEPEIFGNTAKVLLPKDFVRLKLTGEYVSDMSDAAGTLWLDVARRDWSDKLLKASGLDRSHMPRLVEGTEVSGALRPALARRWGMREGVVVAGGGGDNAASACGTGTTKPGDAFVSIGTSGVLFVADPGFSPDPERAVHAFCHAVPHTWHRMGVILSAAASLEWLAGVLGREPAKLTEAVKLTGPSPVLFLPYLSGDRTPHNDAFARGAFVGLDQTSDPGQMTQAVLEGVAFAFRDCLDVLGSAGAEITRAVAVGGGSKSVTWLKIIANVLGIAIDVPGDGDFGAAFGAARLGLVAATGADPAEVLTPVRIKRSIWPEQALADAYGDAHRRYRDLYPAIRGAMSA